MGIIKDIHGDIEREAALLLDRYRDTLMLEALALSSGDSHAAEELVLQTFEAYLFGRERFDPAKGELLPWLRGILRNIHGKSGRGKSVKAVSYLSQDELELISEIRRQDNSTDEEILSNSDSEVIRKVIEALPDKTRRIIVLRCFESASFGEIARLLGISEISVKNRFYYARKLLARRLGKLLGRAPAIALGVILAGASLLYAAAVVTGLAPMPFAATEPVAGEPEVVFNAKSTKDTEGALTGLPAKGTDPAPAVSSLSSQAPASNHESRTTNHESSGDSPQQSEAIIDNSNTNTEENAMNTQMVKSAAVKAMAAGAMLAATAPALSVRSARADSLKNYQVLQYLESSGTQAIDTGVKFGGLTRLYVHMQALNGTTSGQVGAVDQVANQYDRFHFRVENSKLGIWVDSSGKEYATDGSWHRYEFNQKLNRVVCDGTYLGAARTSTANFYRASEKDHSTIWLFGRNSSTASLKQYAAVRIGKVDILQDERRERLLLPCRRKSDNVLGMYDLIKREFLTNVGTGTFTAGPVALGCIDIPALVYNGEPVSPEVSIVNAGQKRVEGTDYTVTWESPTETGVFPLTITPIGDFSNEAAITLQVPVVSPEGKLPAEYQRIAYLESTKDGLQQIDTLVHPTGNIRFEIRFQSLRSDAMGHVGMIDALGNSTYERFHMGLGDSFLAGIGRDCTTGYSYSTLGYRFATMAIRTRPQNNVPCGWFALNSTNVVSITNIGTFRSDNTTFGLFGRLSNNDSFKIYSAYRVMYMDVKEGADQVQTHHFVPCRRIADGELGVYDTVARQFHYDTGREARGAAAFVAGPDVGDSWRPGTAIYLL